MSKDRVVRADVDYPILCPGAILHTLYIQTIDISIG